MQVQKPKQGYKLVKSLFGKYEEIPNDWNLEEINRIAVVNPEQINEEYKHDLIKYVDISSIDNFQITKYDNYNITERPSRAQRIARQNDLLISTVRPYLKSFTKIINKESNLVCSTGFTVIRCKILSDVDFIFNYFKSHLFEKNFIRQMEGMAYPAITSSDVSKSLIPLPARIEERKQIGQILSNVDSLIQHTQKEIEQTQRLKKGLMQRLLTRGIGHTKFKKVKWLYGKEEEIPNEWETKPVSEIAIVTMGQSPSGESYTANEGIPLLNGPTEFGLEYPIPIQFTTSPTKLCQEKDILLCVRGSTTGRLNLADKEYCIGRGLAAIRGLKNTTYTKWLYYQYVQNQDDIYNIASGGGSTFPNINQDLLRKMLLPFPKFEEQHQIALILSNVDFQIQKQQEYKSKIETLKKGLMQKLLTGKIRVKT